jgi:hypothetical protein
MQVSRILRQTIEQLRAVAERAETVGAGEPAVLGR